MAMQDFLFLVKSVFCELADGYECAGRCSGISGPLFLPQSTWICGQGSMALQIGQTALVGHRHPGRASKRR